MSKRNALRELSRKFPAPPEIEAIMKDLLKKDDLHAAIIAVSIVEATLEQIILKRLHHKDASLVNDLFQNRGPLSDFNSKILIAHAFGIIRPPLANELHVMRAIRNAFAHAKMPITFNTEAVEREVKKIKMLDAMRSIKIPVAGGEPIPFDIDPKSSFLLATRVTLLILDTIAKSKSPADKVLKRVLRQK